jgi:hypothetical protein
MNTSRLTVRTIPAVKKLNFPVSINSRFFTTSIVTMASEMKKIHTEKAFPGIYSEYPSLITD